MPDQAQRADLPAATARADPAVGRDAWTTTTPSSAPATASSATRRAAAPSRRSSTIGAPSWRTRTRTRSAKRRPTRSTAASSTRCWRKAIGRPAGLVHGVVEEFAQSLADVAGRLLDEPAWHGTERMVVGGGMRASRVGELAIGRASMLLKGEDRRQVDLVPIRHDPDEAGLIGGAHLAPAGVPWRPRGPAGGGHRRHQHAGRRGPPRAGRGAGPVRRLRLGVRGVAPREGAARAGGGDRAPSRHAARAGGQGGEARAPPRALHRRRLSRPHQRRRVHRARRAEPAGRLGRRRVQPAATASATGLPRIGGRDTVVVVHNDAVVQGLSQAPWMRDVRHWAVLTIGTGLGNASFTNRDGE